MAADAAAERMMGLWRQSQDDMTDREWPDRNRPHTYIAMDVDDTEESLARFQEFRKRQPPGVFVCAIGAGNGRRGGRTESLRVWQRFKRWLP